MKRILFLLLILSVNLRAQEIPKPIPGSYVHDFAGVLTPDQVRTLHSKLIDIKRKSTVETAIVTIKELGDYDIQVILSFQVIQTFPF